jgi:acyl-coenzyme A synthetase/AMP-(fatty) acid ligase
LNGAELLLGSNVLERHGSRKALTCGDEAVTYNELAERVARSAGALAQSGVRPGERVVMLMRDTIEAAAAWLGAVRLGAVSIALNHRLSQRDLSHILEESAARLVLVDEAFAAEHSPCLAPLASAGRLIVTGASRSDASTWRGRCVAAPLAPAHDLQPEDAAFALYTSGTTGKPKGMLHSHGSFRQLGKAFGAIGIGAGERVFTTSKLFFAYGLEHGLLGVLAIGGESILFPEWPDAAAVIDLVRRHQPAAVFSVPTIYRRLLAETRETLAPFRSVRRFVAGGERLSRQLVEQWKQATGSEILNLYGMSETFCACMVTPPGTSDGLCTGKLLDGVQARLLLDGVEIDRGGDGGVLWLRHPAQTQGYLNLPEQTGEQFKDGWFCTRDVFVRDQDGFFVHQGRSDELVKVAGQWVWPGELEAAVAGLPAIVEAACVPVPDADGLERLALFVTARGDAAEALRAAAEACERALPRHKRPKWVRAVGQLPRTATGKVQRFKLREMLENADPAEG